MSPHMIDEINASKKSYIHETPQYHHEQFLSQQQKRFSNRKSDGRHPFSQQPSQTMYEDPLVVGSTHHRFGNFLEYNNRAISSETKHLHGGALMYKQPHGGEMSDSCSDYSSDEEGGELEKKSRDELLEMVQGAGIYDDYVKPAGRFLGNVGKEVFSDVIVPVGKELVKDAVKGAVMGAVVGAGKRGRPKGSKNKNQNKFEEVIFGTPPPKKARKSKKVEPVEALVVPKQKKSRAINAVKDLLEGKKPEWEEIVFEHPPNQSAYLAQMDIAHRGLKAHLKDEIQNLKDEKARVEGEKKFEEGMIKEAPKKARKPRKKVLKNIEDELHRVEGESKIERAKVKKVKREMTDKAKERAEIVKKVMKEHGLKLGAASKYVKDHNLWQPAKGTWL